MASLQAGVRGDKRLIKKFNKLPELVQIAVKRELVVAGKIVESMAKQLMTSPKSGRTYRKPGTKQKYIASRPGEAPAVRVGDLFKDVISQRTVTRTALGFKVDVGTNTDYGAILENDKNRPWLEPALIITKNENIRAMTKGIKKALKQLKKGSNGSNGVAA